MQSKVNTLAATSKLAHQLMCIVYTLLDYIRIQQTVL